jgi:sugar phosphate isomerase/epimerase
LVPEKVAAFVRPMLDLRKQSIAECGEVGKPSRCVDGEFYTHEMERERRFGEALHNLTEKRGSSADEALVVLMCFYVGESDEEADAVIKRGRRMLPYLKKYGDRIPIIPNREYPGSMLHNPEYKTEYFKGVTKAIHKGWSSSAYSPEG